MAEEDEIKPYKLTIPGVDGQEGEERATSKDFGGEAKAEYPSGDVYDGIFENGVSYNF